MLLNEPGKLSVTVLVLEVQVCWKTSQIEKERQKKCCSVHEKATITGWVFLLVITW